MGYHEVRPATHPHQQNKRLIIYPLPQVPCQLCQVPFKIGRFRTQFEPRAAAWAYDNADEPELYGNCEEDGCKLAFRHHNPQDQTAKELSKDGSLDEMVDFVPSGVDLEGKEVSFKTWLTLHGEESDDDTKRSPWAPTKWATHGETYLAWYEERTKDGRKNLHSRSQSFYFPGNNQPT
jgi:hypothetical protein